MHKAKMGKPDIHFDDLNFDKGYNKFIAYAQSKLANLLFAYELDRQLKANKIDITVVAALNIGNVPISTFCASMLVIMV